MISLLGLIDGITATMVVLSGFVFGSFFIYQSKKRGAKLLKQLAFIVIFAGLLYLGVFLDFVWVLTMGKNLSEPKGLVAILSYIWFPPAMISAVYLALGINNSKYTWHGTIGYMILTIFFYIHILFEPLESFYIGSYAPSGEGLIDYNIQSNSLASLYLIIMLAPIIIGLIIGAFYYGRETTGAIRKQFSLLGLGVMSFGVFGLLEGFVQPGTFVIFIRIGYLTSFLWMYFGLTRSIE